MPRTIIVVDAKVINKPAVHSVGTRTGTQIGQHWGYAASTSFDARDFHFRDNFNWDTESRYMPTFQVPPYEISREDEILSEGTIRRTIRYSDGATVQATISGNGDVVRSDRGYELVSPDGNRIVMNTHGRMYTQTIIDEASTWDDNNGFVLLDTTSIGGIPHGGRYDEPETNLDRLRRVSTLISSGVLSYNEVRAEMGIDESEPPPNVSLRERIEAFRNRRRRD